MHSIVMFITGPSAGSPRGPLPAARAIAASRAGDGRTLAVATLLSWLLTEGLGAHMLSRLLTGGDDRRSGGTTPPNRPGGRRRPRPRGVSPQVMFGHAGLAFAGFVCWVTFLATSSEALAWLAVGLLAPAIGLGISAVTVWTPYPTHRAVPDGQPPASPQEGPLTGEVTAEKLADALRDDTVTSKLVDDLLAGLLTAPAPPPRRTTWRLSP